MALVQVQPQGNGQWAVRIDGEQQGGPYRSQAEADNLGRTIAKEVGAEYQLHGADGKIREKDSYGNDPRRIEG